MRSKFLKNQLSLLLVFFVFIAGLHLLLLDYVLPDIYKQTQVIYIYIFLICLSFIAVLVLNKVNKIDNSLLGKAYLAYTVFKMIGSLIFLSPWIIEKTDFSKPFIFQFFAVFFPSLLIETIILLKLNNQKTLEDKKND